MSAKAKTAPKKAAAKKQTSKKEAAAPQAVAIEVVGRKSKKPKATEDAEPKGPGVIGSIVELLTAATEKKALTKQALLAKLKERFPDRPETAMMRTINCQLPTRLKKEKELNVQRTAEGGYWIKK